MKILVLIAFLFLLSANMIGQIKRNDFLPLEKAKLLDSLNRESEKYSKFLPSLGLEFSQLALNEAEEAGSKNFQAKAFISRGKNYFSLELYDSSIACFEKAIFFLKESSEAILSINSKIGLAKSYAKKHDFYKAIIVFNDILENENINNFSLEKLEITKLLADLYFEVCDFDKALIFTQNVCSETEEINSDDLLFYNIRLADIYYLSKQYSKILEKLLFVKDIIEQKGSLKYLKIVDLRLLNYYLLTKNSPEIFKLYNETDLIRSELIDDIREQEISNLQDKLKIVLNEFEAQKKNFEEDKNRIFINFLIGNSIILTIFIFFVLKKKTK